MFFQFRHLVGVHIEGEVVDSTLGAVLVGMLEGEAVVDVEASGTEGDATPMVDEDVSVAVLFIVDVVNCAGVEVEETNGGAFSMYDPEGWTA